MEQDKRRERMFVANAAYEQAMGRGGVPGEEVPVPFDDGALDCPDTVTKAEWDALWPSEDLIRPIPIRPTNERLPVIHDRDAKLTWVLLEREGVCSNKDFAELLRKHAPAHR